ncbi:ubl carboxyl-terminal hydrolase 18-like isoform X2 [Paramormyrops kingsleyae]|uniref:ubl carboxyl-terminal hydrolase 18-like isoform X2 n=1 Tax=Paramormyrops kingsleyae TaxID=1676925 RepID=UPI003B96E146
MSRNKRCSRRRRRKRSHAKKMKQIIYKCASCASSIDKRAKGRGVDWQSRLQPTRKSVASLFTASKNGKKEDRHATDFQCSKTSISTNEFTDTFNSLGSSVDPVKQPDIRYYGLHNLGATCYLNAVLQTLFMTKQFREAVESPTLSDHLRSVFKMLKEGTTDVGNELLKSLGITNTNEQQDAAEYFQKIVSSCNITKIYHGTLRDSTKCLKKGHTNGSESSFVILPLALESRRSYSVEDGWKQFFKPSFLNGDNQLYCDDCDEKTDAEAVCELVSYPEVLTLQLKRFYFDYNYMMYMKNNCKVEIPVELVTQKYTYELYAIIKHKGSVKFGHYYTIIKSFEGGKWYHFDDSRVTEENPKIYNEKTIKSDYAFMLMYTKRSGGKEHTQGAEGGAGTGGQGAADRCITPDLAGDSLNAVRSVRVKNYVTAENAGDSVSGERCTDEVSKIVQHPVKATKKEQRKHERGAARDTGSKQHLKNSGKAGHEDRVDRVPFNKAGNRDYHTQY